MTKMLLEWMTQLRPAVRQCNSGKGAVQVGSVRGDVTVHVTQFVATLPANADCAQCVIRAMRQAGIQGEAQ